MGNTTPTTNQVKWPPQRHAQMGCGLDHTHGALVQHWSPEGLLWTLKESRSRTYQWWLFWLQRTALPSVKAGTCNIGSNSLPPTLGDKKNTHTLTHKGEIWKIRKKAKWKKRWEILTRKKKEFHDYDHYEPWMGTPPAKNSSLSLSLSQTEGEMIAGTPSHFSIPLSCFSHRPQQ